MKPIRLDVCSKAEGHKFNFIISPELGKSGEFYGLGVCVLKYGTPDDFTSQNIASHLALYISHRTQAMDELRDAYVPLAQIFEMTDTATNYLRMINAGIPLQIYHN